MSLLDDVEKQVDTVVHLRINRPLYDQNSLNQEFSYEKPKTSLIDNISTTLKQQSCHSCATSVLPVIDWLRKYKWRDDILSDIISGITVAIMHIPQGMAYALLGNLPPVVGIYMAFFPVLVYFFFGTSRHVSMGTFAIVCLMTGKAVAAYSTPQDTLTDKVNGNETVPIYTPQQVATAVTFTVGIMQIMMFFLRLGIISTLLSETLVNGFTTGAAIHVLMSQIKDLLGLTLRRRKVDHFEMVYTTIDTVRGLKNPNYAAIIVSAVAIVIMWSNNEYLKPWIKKKCSMPLPIELIAVVTGSLISNYFDLSGRYSIKTVGDIPKGLPKPEIPTFQLLPTVAVDCIAITMVSYTITLSMALIFAQKLQYDIDSNQELFAMGISNVVGSFFPCMPVSASLSRSLIQQTVGGKTQIASIVSCALLLIILLWIGPFFEALPRCVLASIIVVALKGMLLQAKQLPRFWRLSKLDGMVWIVTVLTVVLIGIDIGLLAGLLTSVASILLLSIKPYACLLGHVPNTDLYLDLTRYKSIIELQGIKIFHYCGGLNFANANHFKSQVFSLVGVIPQKVLKIRAKRAKNGLQVYQEQEDLNCVIMDMSALSYVDPSGIKMLHAIADDFSTVDIEIYIAGCSAPVFESFVRCEKFSKGDHSFKIFATIHDAVTYACDKFIVR
ncbi:solute carrier family 26 member 6 isoform X1 [Fopius arisanus]|uniref:Solute carrier family 26 member 6 isoform X1 n=1 Tax=Fopius arisanus TaxID=64838 RepID=A0A9R1UAZ2_9HYME|nr:PREDICTED: solute carrier family 26 member 6-like isoform X1 [Fopius arisanus]